ncbi:uncharacterized protein [Halyomorpha halys]|uniref:uncharacterized protein n=1 Tax=Halyomorpha halys TaxID=286706 RepID=UPI0006D4C931|nr:uncharacterized protein LOC106681991 [Halyomorpha halys]
MQSELVYLGHLISRDGVKPDPLKVKAIQGYPKPQNVKEIRAFLGLSGYYRRFIPNYAERSRPLTELTKSTAAFEWTPERTSAFEDLCTCLKRSPVLCYPDFSLPFILSTDASGVAVGAVLAQKVN